MFKTKLSTRNLLILTAGGFLILLALLCAVLVPGSGQPPIPKEPGWHQVKDVTYYIFDDGTPATGWQKIDGKTYYFSTDGTNLTPEGFDCGAQPYENRAWVFKDGQGYIIEFYS